MNRKGRKLAPPCGYMGGKRKVAQELAGLVAAREPEQVYDLCAGSGAVTLGFLNLGFSPEQLTMVEAGPWGGFWFKVAAGTLDLDYLRTMLRNEIPRDPKKVAAWLKEDVAHRRPDPEEFLVLQAGSFGAVPCWWDGDRWRQANPEHNRGYNPRPYWEPGPDSKETKPRGTIFNPGKILSMVEELLERCAGMNVVHGAVEDVDYSQAPTGSVFVMDPPYGKSASGYGFTLDVMRFVRDGPRPMFVLEGRKILGSSSTQVMGMRRGHNVNRGVPRQPDVLNVFEE